ncbi:multimeric flavodoxin WrbA [Methanocalculus alkaliphilus]|uniref:flavodoxin family protein n=1 Tax=Methanocalculus alkaliphilus TaxID=768730 RepID=UPI00209D1114|nr:flavodoxin family protein [Methanocalculus alkaliphilus]MCP1716013.1 multimeric flavodoxin WrbA [Methanocalculus alkaliphilus]
MKDTPMKVLGISGSMRREGNTAILVHEILGHVAQKGVPTEFISLSGKEIKPCIGCEKCKEEKCCVIKNDDWHEIIEKVVAADVLVIGSPTYYFDVCGQVKNLIDRTYSLWHDRKLAGKKAVAISVCADKGGTRALETLEAFLSTHEYGYIGHIIGRGFNPGDVREDSIAMGSTKPIADRIVSYFGTLDD